MGVRSVAARLTNGDTLHPCFIFVLRLGEVERLGSFTAHAVIQVLVTLVESSLLDAMECVSAWLTNEHTAQTSSDSSTYRGTLQYNMLAWV
jgi:hypothetical protein